MFDGSWWANKMQGDTSARLLAEWLLLGAQWDDVSRFVPVALEKVRGDLGARYVALVTTEGGCWTLATETGVACPLPHELLADALDREEPLERDSWQALPLDVRGAQAQLLVAYKSTCFPDLTVIAAALAMTFSLVHQKQQAGRRITRLEMILKIAQKWNQTNEMGPLLIQIAEAATHLLAADRASIFLWDRSAQQLVGRPALGVENEELRIPDDTGIVGQVIHDRKSVRVGVNDEGAAVDRKIAKKLCYEIKTLLCVPLQAQTGEILGVFEVLNKAQGDFSEEDQQALEELAAHAAVSLENTQQFSDLLISHRQIVDQAADNLKLVGDSPAMEALRSMMGRVADTELAILILGENGTGKEVMSRSIHYLSRRRDQPFLAVNCAALAESLLESELFGHEKGAFTGAHETCPGKFEQASGGTLFLDEIGDLSLAGQAKLLRVLEDKTVVRVGGLAPIHTEVRVVTATNRNLVEMVEKKTFREDLYYRLNVLTLEMPPLRERGDDVMFLAEYFLHGFCHNAGRKAPEFSSAAQKRLLAHHWPGNVRELRNLMERIAYLFSGDRVEVEDLVFSLAPNDKLTGPIAGLSLSEATHRFQKDYISRAVEASRCNISVAARRLGLHRSNLYRKMRQLGMSTKEDEEET